MRWTDVVAAYPNQWLVIEALEAHVEVVDTTEAEAGPDAIRASTAPLARGSSTALAPPLELSLGTASPLGASLAVTPPSLTVAPPRMARGSTAPYLPTLRPPAATTASAAIAASTTASAAVAASTNADAQTSLDDAWDDIDPLVLDRAIEALVRDLGSGNVRSESSGTFATRGTTGGGDDAERSDASGACAVSDVDVVGELSVAPTAKVLIDARVATDARAATVLRADARVATDARAATDLRADARAATVDACEDAASEVDAIPQPIPHVIPDRLDESSELASDDETSDGVIAGPIADATIVANTRQQPAGWTFRRVLDRVRVLEVCGDGRAAQHALREHQRGGGRELLCVHTSYPSLQFEAHVPPTRAGATRRATGERMRAARS